MSLRFTLAKATSSLSTWGLKYIFRRPAANFPGKFALYVDPQTIAHCTKRLKEGSIAIVGTNGKTTITNMLADTLERAGYKVACNRTGANLDSGIATTLLQTQSADWAVLECDELYLAHVLPQLKARYVLLNNLFRDQLDRAGEIDVIQKSIIAALKSSPETTFIYNADDPFCTHIANSIDNKSIPFGLNQDLHLEQNSVIDAQICQNCLSMLEYDYRQYNQFGEYHCTSCDFKRPALHYAAQYIHLDESGMNFTLVKEQDKAEGCEQKSRFVSSCLPGAYTIYNCLALSTAAWEMSCGEEAVQKAIDAYNPQNGRLQYLTINNRSVLMNLAKNPVGFNQNLSIVLKDKNPFALSLYINDKEADGHDISWLWDIDFEQLASRDDIYVYAGGIRKNDMQLRLKYAGVHAELVDSAEDFMKKIAELPKVCCAYAIANYTALPVVKADLERLASQSASDNSEHAEAEETVAAVNFKDVKVPEKVQAEENLLFGNSHEKGNASSNSESVHSAHCSQNTSSISPSQSFNVPSAQEPVVIVHLYPELLNLYGDGGNVKVLCKRLEWRGIPYELREVHQNDPVDLATADLVFLGGGPDREQKLASLQLLALEQQIRDFVEDEGVLLAICGGYQILGKTWLIGDESIPGLSILPVNTGRAGSARNRLVDNIALKVPGINHPVVGYENHAGRTFLEEEAVAFGQLISRTGHGNNDSDKADGVRYKNVFASYLHGPLLGKNPELSDLLLENALKHCAKRTKTEAVILQKLDDEVELAANAFMAQKLC